jgi:hypothetical protein
MFSHTLGFFPGPFSPTVVDDTAAEAPSISRYLDKMPETG